MITGAHSIIYSKNPEADRAFLRDVLKFPSVDVGHGWLIFGLPPSEVAIHPGERNDVHEFYLMCADVEALIAELSGQGVACSPVQNLGWGLLTQVTLPWGGANWGFTSLVMRVRHQWNRASISDMQGVNMAACCSHVSHYFVYWRLPCYRPSPWIYCQTSP